MPDIGCRVQERQVHDEADDVCLGGLGSQGQGDAAGALFAEMNAVIPWKPLLELIEPYYPKAGNGTQPMPLERMLRIHFMQHWFNLSDPATEDSLYDSESMRRFARIELVDDKVPDETTILRFRHLLEQHGLSQQIFAKVGALLDHKRLLLKSGTIVDATIIEAPPSTKNEAAVGATGK